jgi:hypothetical protein
LRWAVNLLEGVFNFGWTGGCPFHMILTAYGSHHRTTVLHQVGKEKIEVTAPETIKAYNTYIVFVDKATWVQEVVCQDVVGVDRHFPNECKHLLFLGKSRTEEKGGSPLAVL